MTQPAQPVKYFALPQETLQEVLRHLAQHPITALYEKVSQALPVQQTSEPAAATEVAGTQGTTTPTT